MERIFIIGSREGINLEAVRRYVSKIKQRSVIVTGGHPNKKFSGCYPTEGVDKAAYESALQYGHIPVVVVANWEAHGVAAGHFRNPVIIDISDRGAAFWNLVSSGTSNGIEYARKIGKPIEVFTKGDKL